MNEHAFDQPPDDRGNSDRHRSPYSTKEKIGRVLWGVCAVTLFRFSPRPCWGFRIWLLRLFGGEVHGSARIHPTVRIFIPWNLSISANVAIGDRAILYALGPIAIGQRSTVSQHAHLCAGTHDFNDAQMPLVRPPISIGADVWIAADAFVGPGCSIGDGVILGARGVTMKDLSDWTIYAGNPARKIKDRDRLG
ncbi:MAG: acetyltransferase [Planctomycetota bacterium]